MPPLGLPLKFLPLILGVSAAAVAFCSYVGIIFTGGVGKNGSSVAVSGPRPSALGSTPAERQKSEESPRRDAAAATLNAAGCLP